MSRSIRRLLACLLILLLPFAAIAGSLARVDSLTRHCPPAAKMRSADCCKHDSKAGAAAACCSAAAASIAALPAVALAAPPQAPGRAPMPVLAMFYESFIPDSLHRPPRSH
ncbi:MAG: hypothetical protein ABIT83_21210 [Massilia sp.]